MSPEWLTALGTIGTFVVIAASAAAALFQLRHMRSSNQIVALTEMRETMESADFMAARRFVNHDLPRLLQDPENRRKLSQPGPVPIEFEPVRTLAAFFETTGALVKRGIIDREIVCDLWAPIFVAGWKNLQPWVMSRRATAGLPQLYENFEYLTVLAQQWIARHPAGDYPPGFPRLPGDAWPEAEAPK